MANFFLLLYVFFSFVYFNFLLYYRYQAINKCLKITYSFSTSKIVIYSNLQKYLNTIIVIAFNVLYLGFACTCGEHSIAIGSARCKPCNMTEVVSSDGTMCVPRRCQSSAGRTVCRKCPLDYLTGKYYYSYYSRL